MKPTIAQTLAEFAASHRDDVPAAVRTDAVGRLLDVVGNALAAREADGATEPAQVIHAVVSRRGGLAEAGTLFGADRLPASAAALVNGTLAHALDFDDTHLPSVLHPSAAVVPAALAVAEAAKSSGPSLLAAVAVGDEVCNRLGLASYVPRLRNSSFFERGLHATSICGTVGAAVASAMLLGLSDKQISDAIGIAASMGAGLIEANRTGGTVKRIHCGWAAHAGVEAATYAAAGITGPPTVIEGRFGFLQAFLGDDQFPEEITKDLGERWEVLRTVYKPYPSNHFTHPGIDCALALRAQGISAADVVSAELGVAAAPLRTIGEPRPEKIRPRSGYHAKFSGPFAIATAMLGGGGLGVYLDDFTDAALTDPARLALAAKVTVVADPICDDEFPHAFSAVLRLTTHDGRTHEHRVHSSRGGPDHPLSTEDIEAKFMLNATRVLPSPEAADVARRIRDLPATPRVTSMLAAGPPATTRT
ncbi:MmgE/PrpD family protein [Micromonospora sp. WMMD975]|uniref:MmgE/PrpD family protein n=1 Tax=Micromonospora sp. WMMD975 TaxID=3016087 RepID=UPI00249BAC0F|nr:MmgE/PrpD family protein [Micromonospora sp. WMMD975]WFE33894.1 MmgE/PrpD family protein [Micromonospora sp. WMMD975]